MIRKIFFVACISLISIGSFGQIDYNRQYANGKQLFREGKYNLAMETLKPLLAYDAKNPFAEYAAFYYAVAAYHQGYKAVAKDQLNQIRKNHSKWDKMDEVNFWLAKIHMDNRDYFQGLKVLESISDKKFQRDIEALKTTSLKNVSDIETLKMMREEHPKDEIITRQLATTLSHNLADPANMAMLESLIQSANLKRSDYIPEAPKTFTKDRYSVSVIMPFMVNTLEPTASRKRNQIVLDFYEGMKLAADTLSKSRQSVNISLRAYDTERDLAKMRNILNTEELKNTDLIVGPFFQEESKPVLDFSLANKINVFNPFVNNSELIDNNPHSFLFQPSWETIGMKSGEFLATHSAKKTCLVFYGPTKRDSIMAENFVQTATAKGMQIVASKKIPKDGVKDILSILATPTEFDEFRYPKEFTLKKDSLGSIFVASDDPLLYVKVVSGVETRGDKILVLGQENWLDNSTLDFEKYQTLPIALAAPNFIAMEDPEHKAFIRKFIRVHGRVPSAHAKMGYELMLFAGNQLRENGVYFQEGLNRKGYFPGFLYQGYNFQYSRSNQFVPFIRYEDDRMKVIQN
jgi:tetratricopeptide (TPR) repeat protein